MKKYSLKKTLVVLTLVSTMTFNLSGCLSYSGGCSSSDNSSQTEMADGTYRQANYFFVHLDNNMYFTTRELSAAGDYFDYYDAKTGELVARMLKPLADSEVVSHWDIYHDVIYKDSRYFNGEYGYGKIVPKCSLIPLDKLMNGSTFTQEDFDFFSSNSDELKRKIEKCISCSSYKAEDSEVLWDNMLGDRIVIHTTEVATLRKYDCVSKDGEKSTFIAYQCSYNEKDVGYNYIYDILTGTIHYIGTGLENEFESISVSTYDNYDNKTVATLIDEFGVANVDAKEDSTLEDSSTESPSLEDAPTEESKIFQGSELFVLDSQANSGVFSISSEKRYYFLIKTGEKLKFEDYVDEVYKDIYDENADISIQSDGQRGIYQSRGLLISYVVPDNEKPLFPFAEFLALNGLEEFINKDGKYSLEEISKIEEMVNVSESQKQSIK